MMADLTLFGAASKYITKSAGSKTLHPVKDLNSAERFRILSIVKREESFWFWKKPKMIPTQHRLEDLLLKKLKLPSSAKVFTIMEKFVDKPSFKINGKLGTKICSQLNLDVEGSDTLDMSISLGDIQKTEMNWELLQEFLRNNTLNVAHPLLKEAKKAKRTMLCIVMESLSTKGDGTLEEKSDEKVSTDDGLPVSKSVINVDISVKGSAEKTQAHSFIIPCGTVVAYSCNEFSIEHGIASLHAAIDSLDESSEPLFKTSSDVSDPALTIKSELQPLLKSDKFEQLRIESKLLLEDLTDDALEALHLLLSTAEIGLEHNSDDHSLSISTLRHLFVLEANRSWKEFLLLIGFMCPEDFTNMNARVQFPSAEHKNLLKACLGVVDAIKDIPIEERKLLSSISASHITIILKIVENQLNHKDTEMNTAVKQMFLKDPSTELMLKNMGFIEMQADDVEMLSFATKEKTFLMDVYTILYVLSI